MSCKALRKLSRKDSLGRQEGPWRIDRHMPDAERSPPSSVQPQSNSLEAPRNASRANDSHVFLTWGAVVELLLQLLAHGLHRSSFLGLPYRILNMHPKKGTTVEPMGRV